MMTTLCQVSNDDAWYLFCSQFYHESCVVPRYLNFRTCPNDLLTAVLL